MLQIETAKGVQEGGAVRKERGGGGSVGWKEEKLDMDGKWERKASSRRRSGKIFES